MHPREYRTLAHQPLIAVKGTVVYTSGDGIKGECWALIYPCGLAVTRLTEDTGQYGITHINSGLRLGDLWKRSGPARACLKELAEVTDWTMLAGPSDVTETIRKVSREILAKHQD